MKKNNCLFLLIALLCVKANAQEKDSLFRILANNYTQEKVFVHFDKAVYNAGETIWFKAYLTADNFPTDISKNFYTDWYSDSGTLIRHDVYPIIWATSNGQLEVPEKYNGKYIQLKAYTNWMMNFDTAFVFTKVINIFNSRDSIVKKTQVKTSLQFFPEGGNMINGIASFVAFKAVNQFGLPVKINGVIKNDLGEFVDSLKTEHDGMGMLYIANPSTKNTYTAYWQDEFTLLEKTTALPSVLSNGVGLQVEQFGKFIKVKVERTQDVQEDMKHIRVHCFMGSNVLYSARVKLINKKDHTLDIDVKNMPTGVLQVSVFNDNYLPLAERIVFINNDNYAYSASIGTAQKNLVRRGKNVIDINVDDSIVSNMSIAVTDASVITDTASSIYSHLLLSSDIKGYVHNPAYYFTDYNDVKQQRLDLVMLTNGWRKYDWQKVVNGTFPYIRFKKDTSYINIVGTMLEDQAKMVPNQEVMLMTETSDSLKKQFFLPINKKGVFTKNNVIFYGNLKVHYFFVNNKKLSTTEVGFQNGLFNYYSKSFLDTLVKRSINYNPAFVARMKNWQDEYKRLMKIKGSGALEELVVEAKKRRPLDIMDDKYTSGFFSGGDAVQFDLTNDLAAQSSFDIFSYLTGRVAGLNINQSTSPPNVTWRGGSPTFYIDEMPVNIETLQGYNLHDFAYVKAFRPPFFGSSGGGSGGAIALYTRRGEDVKQSGKGIPFKVIQGYNTIKQFYSPNYEREAAATDSRTTLYWNPYIVTNKQNRKATIQFYNNDFSKKLKVVLCGMNQEGKMCWIEKVIE